MFERNYPTDEQLFKLYNMLTFFKNAKIYWHEIKMSGSTIKIKAEPPKGEIDLRMLYIYEDGEVDDDEFKD